MTESQYDNFRDDFIKGYIQIYTGDGKGKTTAAIGLTIRALGAGINVFFAQFIKSGKYSEINILESMQNSGAIKSNFFIKQYGHGCFITREINPEDIKAAEQCVKDARYALKSGNYKLIVLDEAIIAVKLGLIDEDTILQLMNEKPDDVELVFTGRGATERMIERADLVTEMREVKHYYTLGIKARRGIES